MDKRFDTLIAGQGLAGSLLAWHLIQGGQRVCVIDDDQRSCSSRVAAGLLNPITGKRLTLTRQIGPLLDSAMALYAVLQQQAGRPFFYPLPMLRIYTHAAQRDLYHQKRNDPGYRSYLGRPLTAELIQGVYAPYGGFFQHRTGYLDVSGLLDWTAQWLRQRQALITSALGYGELTLDTSEVMWRGIRARRLIFCQGCRGVDNPWFSWLPFQLAKGEILEIQPLSGLHPQAHIINAGHWLLPSRQPSWRFGATHQWHFEDHNPTAEGMAKLSAAFNRLFGSRAPEIIGTAAGVRPTTRDHLPFVGQHQQYPSLFIFNGFGARGTLLIPWYARRFCAHLLEGEPLPVEADVRRFAH